MIMIMKNFENSDLLKGRQFGTRNTANHKTVSDT